MGPQRGRGEAGTYVFQSVALMVLQEPVLAAEVALAEAAVPDNALGRRGAVLDVALCPLDDHFGRRLRRT
jgi:hypothetical protein